MASGTYLCIDLKSYYASVECVARGLDPLKARLLVADESRSEQTICLAVSPALKAIGVPSRPRLFEARQAIRLYEARHRTRIDYLIAVPRMAEYIRVSEQIYSVYLRYVAPDDIHVYSIDECFLDCSRYLHAYPGEDPAHTMAMTIIRDVLKTTGITATVGIGTNLYLAKVAMDIVAKKSTPDADGVRIAALDEDLYKILLWDHRPLSAFWQIGRGTERRLAANNIFTMADIAERSVWDEEFFYRCFGVNAEILIDHAWGIEPVTMADIKAYRPDSNSLSKGQVLPRPYEYSEARLVFQEMADLLCMELRRKSLITDCLSWWVSYDWKSLERLPGYEGVLAVDFYGRLHPKPAVGTVRLRTGSASAREILPALLEQFEQKTDPRLLFRRLNLSAGHLSPGGSAEQLNLFTESSAEQETRLAGAMLQVREKYGVNALFRGFNLLPGATALERNSQIGGHRK